MLQINALQFQEIMSNSHYNKNHKELARKLRKDGTKGEAILWNEVLRAKKFMVISLTANFASMIILLTSFPES